MAANISPPRCDFEVKRISSAQPMKRKSIPVLWMGMALGVALGLAIAVLTIKGTDTKGLVIALQLTARWSFLLFSIAYTGGAMADLFGSAFESLAGRGQEFGLAYAAAQLIHLALVVWLFRISPRPPLSGELFAFFTIGIVLTYLLAVFSVGGLAETLGSRGWQTLRIVGLNYILFAFAFDFVPVAIHSPVNYGGWRLFHYAPFAAMSVVAPLLVLAAAARRRFGTRAARGRVEPLVN